MPVARLRASFLRVLALFTALLAGTDAAFFWSLPAAARTFMVLAQATLLLLLLVLGLRHLGLVRKEEGQLYRRFVLPNVLTLGRILAIPSVVVGALHSATDARAALGVGVVFGVAALSDLLDGLISRRFDRESILGRFLDPLADAMFYSSVSVGLWVLGAFPPWLAGAALVRFLPPLLFGVWVFTRHGTLEVHPNRLGKVSSFALGVATAIVLARLLVGPVIPRLVELSAGGIAAVLGVAAVVAYVRLALLALERLRA